MSNTELWVHQETAIVSAEFHDLWNFTPEFLIEDCNVPDSWPCRRVERSSDRVEIRYESCRWLMNRNNLWVTEYPDSPLPLETETAAEDREQFGSNVSILAYNFLAAIPTLPFQKLWLFWRMSAIKEEQERWKLENFLPGGWPAGMAVTSVQPRLFVTMEDGEFEISIRSETYQRRGENAPDSVTFDCYVSCREERSVATAQTELENRTNRLQSLGQIIQHLLWSGGSDVATN